MKKMFGVALLALPLLVGSTHASGWPCNIQMSGSWYIRGGNGLMPQAGPWYLYWPLEAHFVAPAPTGYPYWPQPQGIYAASFGGPACPPGVPVVPAPALAAPPAAVVPPPVATAPPTTVNPPPVMTAPVPVNPAPQRVPTAAPQIQLPPYLQPTSYHPTVTSGQPPSYWYER
jgi:hypothetical protein